MDDKKLLAPERIRTFLSRDLGIKPMSGDSLEDNNALIYVVEDNLRYNLIVAKNPNIGIVTKSWGSASSAVFDIGKRTLKRPSPLKYVEIKEAESIDRYLITVRPRDYMTEPLPLRISLERLDRPYEMIEEGVRIREGLEKLTSAPLTPQKNIFPYFNQSEFDSSELVVRVFNRKDLDVGNSLDDPDSPSTREYSPIKEDVEAYCQVSDNRVVLKQAP